MSLKFQPQRLVYANSQRLQNINDSQFLTFRNSNENSVRSIYSQKVQIIMKKANQKQKQKTISSSDDQSSTPSINEMRNFKKKNNSNLRSTAQKIRQRSKSPLRQQKSKSPLRTALQGRRVNQKYIDPLNLRQNQQKQANLNDNIQNPQYQYKNQLLRKKIQKLIKNIKIQRRKQQSLQKQIQQIQKQLDEDQKQIQNQYAQIQQLDAIYQQNQTYLQKLLKNYQDFQNKNNQLQKVVERIQQSLQNLVKTSRQQDLKLKTATKLKQGLVKLQKLKTQINNRCIKIQTEIQKMKQYIEQGQNIDILIRDLSYNGKDSTNNNSHFTY